MCQVDIFITLVDKGLKAHKTKGIYRLNAIINGKVTSKVYARDVEGGPADMTLELIATALGRFNKAADIVIYHEEQYISSMYYSMLDTWKRNGFKNSKGEEVKSKKWWVEIAEQTKKHNVAIVFAPNHRQISADRKSYTSAPAQGNG